MRCEKLVLLDALKRVLPGVSSTGAYMEGVDQAAFDGEYLHANNDAIAVSVKCPAPKGAVKAKELYDLLSKIPQNEIEITESETDWKIVCGRSRASLKLREDSVLPRIQGLHIDTVQWIPAPKDLQQGMSLCALSGNRTATEGIMVAGDSIVATDNVRVAYFDLPGGSLRFWLSDRSVSEVLKIPSIAEYGLSPAWVNFKTADGTIFSCRRLTDSMYPADQIKTLIKSLEKKEGDLSNILPAGFDKAIERASILSAREESGLPVQLALNKTGLVVSSNSLTGSYSEDLDWATPFTSDVTLPEILVDSTFVAQGYKRAPGFHLKSYTARSGSTQWTIFFQGGGYSYCLSTMTAKTKTEA
jgi:hypothetical protein